MPASWAERAKADLDALGGSPTADEARVVTGKYEPVDVGAAIVEKLAGGGGGGLPTGWTEDGDPANVSTNGGSLEVTDATTAASVAADDGANGFSALQSSGEVQATGSASAPAFRVFSSNGATVAFDGGGLPIKNLTEGTDPSDAATVSQLASGGSQPVTREQLYGGAATIAYTATAHLPWTYSFGDTLLDLTDPLHPAAVEAGVYAVTVEVSAVTSMTVDGLFIANLIIDEDNEYGNTQAQSAPAVAAGDFSGDQPRLTLALIYYCPAGGKIAVTVSNGDGANAIDFGILAAMVQRLS